MKLKKEQVYVEVTTQEEADKAKEMLLKYGESIWEVYHAFEARTGKRFLRIEIDGIDWFVMHDNDNREKVTLEQLEEILKREKDGRTL